MIRGMHAMFYSSQPEALRAFLRDKLGLHGTDVGGGWLIFDTPEADLGVHPIEGGNLHPALLISPFSAMIFTARLPICVNEAWIFLRKFKTMDTVS